MLNNPQKEKLRDWKEEFLKVERSLIIVTQTGVTKVPGGYGIELNVDTDKLIEWISNLLASKAEEIRKLKVENMSGHFYSEGINHGLESAANLVEGK